jgi:hypothetical protein
MDQFTLRVGIVSLGVCCLAAIVCMALLPIYHEPIPPALASIAGASIGAIAGMMAQHPSRV